jgi:hypothetical protein
MTVASDNAQYQRVVQRLAVALGQVQKANEPSAPFDERADR